MSQDQNPDQTPETEGAAEAPAQASKAPWPGNHDMPQWNTGKLISPPVFTSRNWFAMLGPGLLMGGAAIGGGEWLVGPLVTAKYGGAMLWLATLSILGQVIYNIEISRYTLYTGEPIFTGKFRCFPSPKFWVTAYLIFDFGSVFPYLAASAATPVVTLINGAAPDPANVSADWWMMKFIGIAIFLTALLPLIFGGKIYNALKAVMTFKIVTIFGFLILVAVCYSNPATWWDILTGFFRFGNVPIKLAPGADAADRANYSVNIFASLLSGKGFPDIDLSTIGFISALAAIAGSGGLSNTPVSNYTRDQGWGMGHHVGAIPSIIGGEDLQLSHVGTVFEPNEDTLPRWKAWYRHVLRDQLIVWMPACFIGMALPAMLSIQFLTPLSIDSGDSNAKWTAAVMTASAVQGEVASGVAGESMGKVFWFMTVFCGFLVLAPSMASSSDGIIRRWVDAFWTASPRLRKMDPKKIKYVYFKVLVIYACFGLIMLSIPVAPTQLLQYATMIFNVALGFSCWHTLYLNLVLLPRELRPGWFPRVALVGAGSFFMTLGVLTIMKTFGML